MIQSHPVVDTWPLNSQSPDMSSLPFSTSYIDEERFTVFHNVHSENRTVFNAPDLSPLGLSSHPSGNCSLYSYHGKVFWCHMPFATLDSLIHLYTQICGKDLPSSPLLSLRLFTPFEHGWPFHETLSEFCFWALYLCFWSWTLVSLWPWYLWNDLLNTNCNSALRRWEWGYNSLGLVGPTLGVIPSYT